MAAVILRNEPTASRRRCDMIIQSKIDGSKAPRGTSFAGKVYASLSSSVYQAAIGTLTNKRYPLVIADTTFTADHTTDTLTDVGHGLETGDGPARLTNTGGALPTGLAAGTDYWIIRTGPDTYQLALSLANAYAGTPVLFSSNGTGTHTLSDTASTQRGIDGQWTYEFAQAETDVAGSELAVAILGDATWEAYTTVNLEDRGSSTWEAEGESGHTYGDLFRAIARTHLANFTRDPVTGLIVYRNLADTKDSHKGTMTGTARTAAGNLGIMDLAP